MRKRSDPRKLRLEKETLRALADRSLSADQLAQVVGGGCPKPSAACGTNPP